MMKYAIVGGGRLARHFSHYFRMLEIPHAGWARDRRSPLNTLDIADAELRLKETLSDADCVLLLVPDHAIMDVVKQYPFLREKQLVHCSGSLSVPGIAGMHPLMTFADDYYEIDVYRSIPFIVENGSDFGSIFPALPNPSFLISVEDKARYHAMCVMAGNFVQILWKTISDQLGQRFEWPAEVLQPYIEQVTQNFLKSPESALTGPLVRNDRQTIDRNLDALENDSLQPVYRSFVNFYLGQKNSDPGLGAQQVERLI